MQKKLFAIIMATCLLLSLCACGGNQGAGTEQNTGSSLEKGQILAGYARANITPKESVPMGSYGNSLQHMSEGFKDPLYITCLYLTDKDGNSTAVIAMDIGNCGGSFILSIREEAAKQLGLPIENVVLTASHTHEAPDPTAQHPATTRWQQEFRKALKNALDQAVADQAPAELEINSAMTERLTFVRRYVLEGGIYVGYESDILESGLAVIGHETEADGEIQMLKFNRGEDKTDILVANFQAHPHLGGGSSNRQISSDFVGSFRDKVKESLGYDVVYITGAAGNLNAYSYITSEQLTSDHREYGKLLAQYVIDAEDTYTKVDAGQIQVATMGLEGEIDHSLDHMVPIAQDALNYYAQTNSIASVREKYHSQGINSPNHANMIINRSSKTNISIDIWAISIGDVAFAVAPYEMFDTQGMFIKENSPYAMTVITTCANRGFGYMPSQMACEHGGYEADNTYFVPGTAEKLADMYLEMLNQMHAGN